MADWELAALFSDMEESSSASGSIRHCEILCAQSATYADEQSSAWRRQVTQHDKSLCMRTTPPAVQSTASSQISVIGSALQRRMMRCRSASVGPASGGKAKHISNQHCSPLALSERCQANSSSPALQQPATDCALRTNSSCTSSARWSPPCREHSCAAESASTGMSTAYASCDASMCQSAMQCLRLYSWSEEPVRTSDSPSLEQQCVQSLQSLPSI